MGVQLALAAAGQDCPRSELSLHLVSKHKLKSLSLDLLKLPLSLPSTHFIHKHTHTHTHAHTRMHTLIHLLAIRRCFPIQNKHIEIKACLCPQQALSTGSRPLGSQSLSIQGGLHGSREQGRLGRQLHSLSQG